MKNELALYIHIPFCDHKCIYCDFYSIIKDENKAAYIKALTTEISNFSQEYSSKVVTSIFFGGGTPSLLTPSEINVILKTVSSKYSVANNVEITLETNPGTVDRNKLKDFRTLGINRISIGVQSFNNNDLKFLTRIHDRDLAITTIEDAANIGFENINVDLIFNLPKQTEKIWEENMQIAVDLPVTHISAYSLILEQGTILNKMILDKKVEMNDEDFDASLYEKTIKYFTRKNFNQYEVSNFCKDGYECKHNLAYWEHKSYLGFGTSAHSFNGNKRWWNFSGVKKYISEIGKKGNAIRGEEKLAENELRDEFVMLALRSKGLDLNLLNKIHGDEWICKNSAVIKELIQNNYLIKNDNFLKFTSKGYQLCDEILTKFN